MAPLRSKSAGRPRLTTRDSGRSNRRDRGTRCGIPIGVRQDAGARVGPPGVRSALVGRESPQGPESIQVASGSPSHRGRRGVGPPGRLPAPRNVRVGDRPECRHLISTIGEDGLIYVKAPATGRFDYYKEPAKTESSYRGDWFTLGDIGRFDEDGYLFLTGRTAELIISGGVNIYPVEIDEVLIRHEAVADAAVIGVPNDDWGEEIKAVVELKPGYERNEATAQSILDFAKTSLPGFQRPRTVDFVDTLPRSPAGKVLRAQVREPYWKGRTKRSDARPFRRTRCLNEMRPRRARPHCRDDGAEG